MNRSWGGWGWRQPGDLSPDSEPCPGSRFEDAACSRAVSGYISKQKINMHEATLTQEMTEPINTWGKETQLQKKPEYCP